MSTNNNKDTHIYNIINNPPREFTEPCECCGVSEFQLGVKHAEERIIKLLQNEELHTHPNNLMKNYDELVWLGIKEQLIALIKGEQK